MFLNKTEVIKALAAQEGEDAQKKSVAVLKEISEEFVKIREEVEKAEKAKAETADKKAKLAAAIKEYNSALSDETIDNLIQSVNHLKEIKTSYRAKTPTYYSLSDLLKSYLDII